MSASAQRILAHLEAVATEREARATSPTLGSRVVAVKAYQQRRFAHTYDDLLRSDRYGAASRFFLDELYGPNDSAHRDVQFARVVPALVRLFPPEIVDTVAAVAKLHALSERLDTAIARELRGHQIDGLSYLRAWQRTGGRSERQTQIGLTADIAHRLDRLTGRLFLRTSLRVMRAPAHAAGLGELQHFIETGFDTFRAMGGAADFVKIIEERESTLGSALFDADPNNDQDASIVDALTLLP